MTLSSADNPLQTVWNQIRPDILSGPYCDPDCLTLQKVMQVEVEPIYFDFASNIYMTLSSADDHLQTVWTQIRPDILSGRNRGPNCLTRLSLPTPLTSGFGLEGQILKLCR